MILSNDCKRLIIYFIYDKQGIVDDYILYMLNALKEHTTELMVVCNGKITKESRDKLEGITPKIIVRDNKGLDVWAYKTALDYYGWEELCTYDEVIMMNFTIMGPVYPLSEMFESMNSRDIDFWGVTMYHEYKEGDPFGTIEVGYIPYHIQSHFIAVRNKMLSSDVFQTYWDSMGEIKDYRDAVGCHEAMFTKRFSDKGFTWDVYADMEDDYSNHPILCATKEMLAEKRCPFFKRRSFMQNYDNIISSTVGQSAIEAYDYIDKCTDYNVDMIWQNILRLENQADIKRNMQLNYIFSENQGTDISEVLKQKRVALILHAYFEDLAEYCLHYVQSMPKEADIYVTVGNERLKKIYEEKFAVLDNRIQFIMIENRGRDVSALLVGTKNFIMDYDYVCFVHDKKVKQLKPESIGAGFSYKCFENLLATPEFVTNVIDSFEKNPRMGLLTPPPPNHGDYFITLGLEWGPNFEVTKNLAEKLKLTVPISEDKEPIAPLGTMFWFRPKAMKVLFDQDWEYKDFPPEPNNIDGTLLHAVERIYSYVAQQSGYYPGWIFSDKGANIEITNLHHMLRGENMIVFHEGPGAGKYEYVKDRLHSTLMRGNANGLHYSEKRSIAEARLYFKINGAYSEGFAIDSVNEIFELSMNGKFEYDIPEQYGEIQEIRWDPGECQVTVKEVRFTIEYLDGTTDEYELNPADTNGLCYKDSIVFFDEDPKTFLKLKKHSSITHITVEGKFTPGIETAVLNRVMKRMIPFHQKIRFLLRRKI